MRYLLDTNVVIDYPELIAGNAIHGATLREMDSLKMTKPELRIEINRAAKEIMKQMEAHTVQLIDYNIELERGQKVDDVIIESARALDLEVMTQDVMMQLLAKANGVAATWPKQKVDVRYGVEELNKDNQDHVDKFNELYSTKMSWPGLYNGRYITIANDAGHVYKVKGDRIAGVPYKSISKTLLFEEFKPRDGRQVAMIDSLYTDKITAISGPGGSGKTLAALTWAFEQLASKKRTKLIIAINPVEVRNIAQLGAYKGDKIDKLLSHNIGGILRSKVGTTEDIMALIESEMIVVDTIANLRGVEIKPSEILYITEAQNLTIDNMKLIVERMSNDAKLIIEGDYKSQVDARAYEGYNNGMLSLIRAAVGVDHFGYIDLKAVYRNQWSRVVERM